MTDELPAGSASSTRVAMKHASDSDLRDIMARRRDRCEVLESVPCPTTADFRSTQTQESSAAADGNSLAASDGVSDNPQQPQKPCNSPELDMVSSDAAELRKRLQCGPLSHDERVRLWAGCLPMEDSTTSVTSNASLENIPPALLDILDPASHLNDEEVLFESCEAGEATTRETQQAQQLAVGFGKIHLGWLSQQQTCPAQDQVAAVFIALSQLLRYHFPKESSKVATALKSVKAAHDGGDALASMLGAVCNSCGMAVDYKDVFFDTSSAESAGGSNNTDKTALLHLCDLATVEGQELLLPFVVLVLLSEVSPEPECTFAELEERLRSAMTLSGLAGRSASEVINCVSNALLLLEATPVSLRAALRCERLGAWVHSPVCMVTPEEVLQHTHEGHAGNWRFIVVDARMRERTVCLPVCMRLAPARHSCRWQALQEMPDDDAMHLCLMGDGAPGRGDEAFELCLCLCGKGSWRKHISIVEGGWPAVEALACSLKLELMPATMVDGDLQDAESGFSEARAVAAEVAEQVAVAKEKVSAAAHSALSGASRALVYLDGRWGAGSADEDAEAPEKQATVQNATEPPVSRSAWTRAGHALDYLDGFWARGRQPEASTGREAEKPDAPSQSKASGMLDYLDGLWTRGSDEQQISHEDEALTAGAMEQAEGPQFRGSG